MAALCGSALPAHASVGLDHGSTVEAGCGAYYSATPDPATTSLTVEETTLWQRLTTDYTYYAPRTGTVRRGR